MKIQLTQQLVEPPHLRIRIALRRDKHRLGARRLVGREAFRRARPARGHLRRLLRLRRVEAVVGDVQPDVDVEWVAWERERERKTIIRGQKCMRGVNTVV